MINLDRHNFEVFPFQARDGFNCNLWRLVKTSDSPKGPVLLVHGAGVRSNIFNPPNEKNLLDALAEAGYDVWLENWRGSIECMKNQWDLDIVSDNDHPVAVKEVCRITQSPTLKAIIHCQGSTSFMISAVKGLVPEVTTIVSNAVSLNPVVPQFSVFKLNYCMPLIEYISKYLNPHWGIDAPDITSKFFRSVAELTHYENDTTVGKLVSFTYGAGHPALWELDNLTDKTKDWIQNEFGNVPMSFFEHIKKCVKAGVLVSRDGSVNYGKNKPKTDARFIFTTGNLNKCFYSRSQENSFQYFNQLKPSFHKIYEFGTYSHLDIFLGKNANHDIFPAMIKELNN